MAGLLLLSGGLDSSSIAAILRPAIALCVDYGQGAAEAELAASEMVATHLDIPFDHVAIDLTAFAEGRPGSRRSIPGGKVPESFPFRNQFLVTAGAAYAVCNGFDQVVLGIVAGDGVRHADGTPLFVRRVSELVEGQEGGVRVEAPFVDTSPIEILKSGALPEEILRRTYSCHIGNLACGQCVGCLRRGELLNEHLGRPRR